MLGLYLDRLFPELGPQCVLHAQTSKSKICTNKKFELNNEKFNREKNDARVIFGKNISRTRSTICGKTN